MRNILLPLAAATTALVVAAPAAAHPRGNLSPAYGAPYGYAYGYNRASPAQWDREIRQISIQMHRLARQGRLTRSEYIRLDRDIRSTERSLRRVSRHGVNMREAQMMNQRIAGLRYELRRFSDWDRRLGRNAYYGDRDGRYDRDHDRWHDRHDD